MACPSNTRLGIVAVIGFGFVLGNITGCSNSQPSKPAGNEGQKEAEASAQAANGVTTANDLTGQNQRQPAETGDEITARTDQRPSGEQTLSGPDFIKVKNPKNLVPRIACQRIPVGAPGDYKPAIAKLANGDLLISAYRPNIPAGTEPVNGFPERDLRVIEPPLLFQSRDGGLTWSPPYLPNIAGKEPYISVGRDGTLFISTHIVWYSIYNREEFPYTYGMLYRSEDGGRTWSSMRLEPDVIRPKERYHNLTTRAPLELDDGSLLLAASGVGSDATTLLRSTDGGKTWPERIPVKVDNLSEDYPWPIMGEGVLWQARSGKVYGLLRVDTRDWPALEGDPLGVNQQQLTDQFDRLIVCSSTDLRNWQHVADLGRYGQMYPSILRLQDGRLLLTFTQRAHERPLGLRAVVGTEHDDGFEFDLDHDVIMIDTKTPDNLASGGGFGSTVQLDDGTLVSSYSYRIEVDKFAGPDRELHCEVARWRLP